MIKQVTKYIGKTRVSFHTYILYTVLCNSTHKTLGLKGDKLNINRTINKCTDIIADSSMPYMG